MSGREEQQIPSMAHHRSSSVRIRVILGAVVCLCVVAAVAAVAVVVTSTGSSKREQESRSVTRSLGDTPGAEETDVFPPPVVRRPLRATTNPRAQQPDMSCITHPSNKSTPAAHIKGRGTFQSSNAESAIQNPEAPVGYQQRWVCHVEDRHRRGNAHAFVDGGMIFNQTDKSLRVPTCGYYHIYSQVLFKLNTTTTSRPAFHSMKIMRNCPSYPDSSPLLVIAKSSFGGSNIVTTYTSDVIMLCQGGRIWIEIQDGENGAPCCPFGDESGTFIGAVLVSPTSCHWPPMIEMVNLNDPDHQM